MSNNKISIIVPIFNASKTLTRCIDSLLNQSYTNLEIILVDDGSIDNSLELCYEYSADSRIHIMHKENGGANSARKMGLQYANGEYVTFVDADDVVEKYAYEIVINEMEDYNVDLLAFKYYAEFSNRFNSEHIISNYSSYLIEKEKLYDNYYAEHSMGTLLWNKVWKRVCLENIEFRDDIFLCEDAVYVWDSLKNVSRALIIDARLYHYRVSLNNSTHASSYKKYYTAIIAWDYLKRQALKKDSASILNIRKSRTRWIIKTAQCLEFGNTQEMDHLKGLLLEDDCNDQQLPFYDKVAFSLLIKGKYILFQIYTLFLNRIKICYINVKKVI